MNLGFKSGTVDFRTGAGTVAVSMIDSVLGGGATTFRSGVILLDSGTTISVSGIAFVTGGAGFDKVSLGLGPNVASTGNTLAVSLIESLIGSSGKDALSVRADGITVTVSGVETLLGGAGTDVVTLAGSGNSVLVGQLETLIGGSGTDVATLRTGGTTMAVSLFESLVGGSANDVVSLAGATNTITASIAGTIIGGAGEDKVTFDAAGATFAVSRIESLAGGVGTDVVTGTGTAGVTLAVSLLESLTGGSGQDVVTLANGGNSIVVSLLEILTGGTGADAVTLGASGNTLSAIGLESVLGGMGEDAVTFTDAEATIYVSGIETVRTKNQTLALAGIETLVIIGAGDAVPPDAPSAPSLAPTSDSGLSSGDKITNLTSLTLTGTAEAGATVTVFEDLDSSGTLNGAEAAAGTAIVGGDGKWSLATGVLAEGARVLTAVATDAAGNTGAASPGLTVTIDLTPPDAPLALALEAGSDTGASTSDKLTRTAAPTIKGTAEAGATVTLYDGATAVGTGTAAGDGTWSITTNTLLSDGVHALTARATDKAGNTGIAAVALTITVDASAPAAPTGIAISVDTDTGASSSDGITKAAQPVLTGTAEANASLVVFDGGTQIATGTAGGDGAFSIALPNNFAAGTHSLTVQGTDAAGNVGLLSAAYTLVVDRSGPAAPTTPVLAALSDTGVSQTDGKTRDTTPTLTGKAETNATVDLYAGATKVGTTTAGNDGSWSITADALSDGAHVLTAKATDLAGNAGGTSTALTIDIDTTAPAAPTAPVLATASDTGVQNADGITRITTPTVSGTAEAGTTVVLFDGATQIGSTLVAGDGSWSVATTALLDGTHSLTAKTSDVAGNLSDASAALSVTIDTSAPTAPSALALTTLTDTGTSSSDGITNAATPVLTGTAEANASLVVFDSGTQIATGTADGDGAFTIALPTGISAGGHSLTVQATDKAGNSSTLSATYTLTVDRTAPTAPTTPALASASDTGISQTDGITSDTSPTLTGTAEAGATVVLFDDADNSGAMDNGETTLASGTATGGTWSLTTTALSPGAHRIRAVATDLAGNTGTASTGLVITVDTTAPALPSVPVLTTLSDSGTSNADGITKIMAPTVTGTAAAGTVVTLHVDGAGTSVGSAVTDGDGNWSITATPLAAGVRTLTARATDAAGNTSAESAGLTVTIDATGPGAPTGLGLTALTDTGASTSDGITNAATPVLTGMAEADAGLVVFSNGVQIATGTADGDGAFSIALPTGIAAGTHSLTVQATDKAGNAGTLSAAYTLTVDRTAPTATAAPILTVASDKGISSADGITNETTPTLTGTAEANALVELFEGATKVGFTTADSAGAWSITASALAEAVHTLTVKTTDVAGNAGAESAGLTFTIDTTPPASAPSQPVLAAATDSGSDNTDKLTKVTTPTLTGTAEAGTLVVLYRNGTTEIGSALADGDGNWAITTASLADGAHVLTARAMDAAGNFSTASTGLTVTIDATGPNAPTGLGLDASTDKGASTSDGITNAATPVLTGMAEADAGLVVFSNGVQIATGTADGDGAFSIALPTGIAAGTHSLTVQATDKAGNAGTLSAAYILTIDRTAPASPSAPTLATGSDTGKSSTDRLTKLTTPALTGTAEAGATVVLFHDADNSGAMDNGETALASGTATGGTWSLTTAALSPGAHRIRAVATDLAGNTGIASTALSITIDTSAPAVPSALALTSASDSGRLSTDGVTNAFQPVLTGTTEASAALVVFDGGNQIATGTAAGDGSFSITLPSNFAVGTHTLTVQATDAAGNVSAASSPFTVIIDRTAPAAPSRPLLTVASDTGLSSADGITKDDTPTVTGTAEADATIVLFDGATQVGTTTALNDGSWSITASALAAGSHTLTVQATDAAGNVGALSAALSLTIDTTAPTTPSAPVLATISDTGSLSSDGITRITTPTLSGTAEAGATVVLFDGSTELGSTLAAGNGSWSFTPNALAEGFHLIVARTSDVAGNLSDASPVLYVTIDTSAPTAPSGLALTSLTDTGASSSDGITNAATPVLTGTAEANASLVVFDSGTQIATGTADGDGAFTIALPTGISAGGHSLTVQATDKAGNSSTLSATYSLTVDRTAPTAPTTPALASASDLGVSQTDGVTSDSTPTFTGTTEAGATVRLYDGSTEVGSATANGSGAWSITASALADGAHTLTAKATDKAGN
ncbi:MAG TPA: Ig-like domain-containing protein, partial [Azospirillaceae bacterium]|nr:Ig-like domain-containing protein [Azospirillaceae bacterium]